MKFVPASLRRIGLVIEPGRRMRWIGLVALAVLVAVMEAVGAVLVFALVSIMSKPDEIGSHPAVRALLSVLPIDPGAAFLTLASVVAAFFLVRSIILLFQAYAQNRVAWSTGSGLSSRLLVGYLTLPYVTQLRRNSAEYVRNCYDTIGAVVSQVFFPAVMVASESLLVASIAIVLLIIAPGETIIGAIVLGPIVILLSRALRPTLARIGQENQDAVANTYQTLQQALHGAREVRLLGAQPYFEREYTRHHRRMAHTQVIRAVLVDAPRIALETLLVLSIVGFVVLVSMRGGSVEETLSVLGLFAYAFLRLMPSIHRIMTQLNHLRFGGPALAILVEELRLIADQGRPVVGVQDRLPFRHEIRLNGVSFQYEKSDIPAIESADLVVRRGESVGIVGSTGGGKSTLLDLLIGILPPSEGKVLVDGVDISTCVERWHACLGMVPQSIYLLDDTLRRNIALGVPDGDIEEGRLERAVEVAQLGDVVAGLPAGLDTIIGERGIRLSGGQRQRVAIARALYREPDVVILDEGTSAVDNVTEATLIRSLQARRGSITLIAVAHRLSTVRQCDRIIVVERGRVIATGTYEELHAGNKAFQRLERGQAEQSIR